MHGMGGGVGAAEGPNEEGFDQKEAMIKHIEAYMEELEEVEQDTKAVMSKLTKARVMEAFGRASAHNLHPWGRALLCTQLWLG